MQGDGLHEMKDDAGGSASVRRRECAPAASSPADSGSSVLNIPLQCVLGNESGLVNTVSSHRNSGHDTRSERSMLALPSLMSDVRTHVT